ncbi:MAG: LysM peptidoglycan-binding domain-containing protein [Thermoanaerobaculia bacterium]
MKKLIIPLIIIFFISCHTAKKETVKVEENKVVVQPEIEENPLPEIQEEEIQIEVIEPILDVEEEVEIAPQIPETEALPPHPAVEEAIKYYTEKYYEKYQGALERFSYYKKEMEKIFQEEKVPTELIYMTLTESLFNPKAKSRRGAYGVWQFIGSTAKLYGLKIDSFIDERADYIKATKAAAKYLKNSLEIFEGDLLLTIASYNCGAGNVLKAQKRCKSQDFWEIRKCLPKETRNFVPSVLASIEIGKDPLKYNFYFEEKEKPFYKEIFIPHSINLKKVLKDSDIDIETIRQINPELKSYYTPPYGYNLKIPGELEETFLSKLPYHIAKENETLKDLELKYKVKAELIARVNRRNINETLKEGEKIFIPEDTFEGYHIVKKGENPFSIAKKYGVPLEKLLEINGLSKRSLIHPGQKLKVPGGYVAETKSYKAKKGDTLAEIARKFSTTVEKIMELNGLKTQNIKPGTVLLIE